MEKKSEYTKMKGSKQLESGWMRRAAFWKMEVIIILMLTGFAFFINRHMKLECLYMDDLYQWYCYNDQSFWDAVFTMGGTRFRVLYNLVSWIEMALFGIHINWYVPFNIILNVGIAYTLYRMSRRFSHSIYVGALRCDFSVLQNVLLSDWTDSGTDGVHGPLDGSGDFVSALWIFE